MALKAKCFCSLKKAVMSVMTGMEYSRLEKNGKIERQQPGVTKIHLLLTRVGNLGGQGQGGGDCDGYREAEEI